MKELNELIKELPAERRAAVEARGEALIAEEMSLRELRKALGLTQEETARRLGVRQDNISRMEGRCDMLLSTLRGYVEAMGGSLELTVRFADRSPVSLSSLFIDNRGEDEPPHPQRGGGTSG